MPSRLRDWLLFPVRHPVASLLAVLGLGVAGFLLWQGVGLLCFRRDRTAAAAALAEYDFPEASRRLAACIRLRPRDPAVRLLAAQAARRDGDLEAAEEHLARYRELAGAATPEGALEWAMLQAQRGQVEDVVNPLIAELEIRHPASEQILEALAMGCVHVYQLERASFWVAELLKRAPHNPIGRLIQAQSMETLGQHDRALEVLRALVQDYPKQTRARLHLAGSLFQARQYEEAAAHYEELRRQQPDQLLPLLGLARCRDRLGRSDEARPLMQQLQARHADDSEALLECGRFALGEGRLPEAERLLRRAVELAPNDHETHYQLGLCLQQQGRPDEASPHLERCKEIEAGMLRLEKVVEAVIKAPADPAPRLEAGEICLRNGQEVEALRWLQGALACFPDSAAGHEAVAGACVRAGRPDLAADYRRQAEAGAVASPFTGPSPGSPRRP